MADPWEQFAEVVRDMSSSDDTSTTMDAAVAGALDVIPHAHHAAISMIIKGSKVETVAASDPMVRRGDELQYELGEGPCLQSLQQEESVHSADLATEERWPAWSKRVVDELEVRSMLCLQLFVTHDAIGALNIYSRDVDAFDQHDKTTALALAAHIAVALSSANEIENLEAAIVNRTVIGQAEGMLMQRYEMSPAAAFSVLARVSQHQNKRLHEVARELVQHGIKPRDLQ